MFALYWPWAETGESFAADLAGFEPTHNGSLNRQFASRVSRREGCVRCPCPLVQSTRPVLKAQLLTAAPRGLHRTSESSQLRCSRCAERDIRQGALRKASLPNSDLGSLKPSGEEGSFKPNCCQASSKRASSLSHKHNYIIFMLPSRG